MDVEVTGQTFPFEVGTNGRFVINEIPGQLSTAARGAWGRDNTFVIEHHDMGEVERGTRKLSFDGTSLSAVLTYADTTVATFTGDRIN